MKIMRKLAKQTFAVQHNPNCRIPYLVRLIGVKNGSIDLTSYDTDDSESKTNDILGFGKTLRQAAEKALRQQAKLYKKWRMELRTVK